MVEITIIARNVCGINFCRFVNFHRLKFSQIVCKYHVWKLAAGKLLRTNRENYKKIPGKNVRYYNYVASCHHRYAATHL